jgi:hypothetical protein
MECIGIGYAESKHSMNNFRFTRLWMRPNWHTQGSLIQTHKDSNIFAGFAGTKFGGVPMHNQPEAWGYLVYEMIPNGLPRFVGLYTSQGEAEAEAKLLSTRKRRWRIAVVPYFGWR